jgi:fluoride exporter
VIVFWVGLGAVVGAPLRYLTDRAVQQRHRSRLPYGTLTVNLVASFVLGLVVGLHPASEAVTALVGTGFCGTLSTYSSFSFETMRLRDLKAQWLAIGYVALSLIAGCGVAALGWAIGAG